MGKFILWAGQVLIIVKMVDVVLIDLAKLAFILFVVYAATQV